eukprot:7693507-Alexandrium_andersonii.AAC.1
MSASLVGSEMCIRDRGPGGHWPPLDRWVCPGRAAGPPRGPYSRAGVGVAALPPGRARDGPPPCGLDGPAAGG